MGAYGDKEGRGPCYMDTRHLTPERVRELKESYLDMYPGSFCTKANKRSWKGTHCFAEPRHGYCRLLLIDRKRQTTIEGCTPVGDVAVANLQLSWLLAEGTPLESPLWNISRRKRDWSFSAGEDSSLQLDREVRVFSPCLQAGESEPTLGMEERTTIADDYAGGISSL